MAGTGARIEHPATKGSVGYQQLHGGLWSADIPRRERRQPVYHLLVPVEVVKTCPSRRVVRHET